jgi:hypothetical protein
VEIERRRQQALYDREQKLIEELRQKKEIEERREQRLREEEERRSEIERQRQELAEKRFQTLRAPQILLPSPANQYAPDISLSLLDEASFTVRTFGAGDDFQRGRPQIKWRYACASPAVAKTTATFDVPPCTMQPAPLHHVGHRHMRLGCGELRIECRGCRNEEPPNWQSELHMPPRQRSSSRAAQPPSCRCATRQCPHYPSIQLIPLSTVSAVHA